MNRKLLVTLLQKNIQELELITQGFMEMTEFPMPIILLAQRKTEDIQLYIKELSELKDDVCIADEIESLQIEPLDIKIKEIEVADEIVLAEIDEVLEIEELNEESKIEEELSFEPIADEPEIGTEIFEIPQLAPEVAAVEEVELQELIVDELLIEEE
ncbi:MAG: hypothetical protein WCJ61_16330, partial [Paludibacter sp.]